MRRWTVLLAGAALWLFLAAIPALADGGPHVAAMNSGASSLTADSCAGCHRAHTAQGPLLLNAPSEEALCLTCHGAASTGATTDVMTGVQYRVGGSPVRGGAQLGALRGGGFDQARIGDPFRYTVGTSRFGKVQVAAAPADVTSAHMPGLGGLTQPGIAWGNGANGSGDGPAVADLSCGSCHNPHGNGQYRILNKIPAATGVNAAWVVNIVDYGVVAPNTYRSLSSMGVINGDTITVAGNTLAGANVANAVITMVDGPDANTTPDDNLFTLAGVTDAGSGTGGTATRTGGTKVTDAALPPAGDARNYTVIQTSTAAGYTLLASQAQAYSATAGDYFHYRVPWNGATSNLDAPNGIPGGSTATTIFTGGFGEQMAAWCASCHTRYWAWSEPTEDTTDPDGTVGPAYSEPRPGDTDFMFQHRTRGASGRGCITCHVSHGSNAVMDGPYSSTYAFPDGTTSANSRLLKVGNRGTCQQCHDPTGTSVAGDQYPPAPYPVPAVP